jgi:hypothetical protein
MRLPVTPLIWCVIGITGVVSGQEEMTLERFKEIEAAPGDTTPLIPQLAALPAWRRAVCSISMKFEDGRVFEENCEVTTKTIQGRYIVFTVESQYYKQPVSSILGIDEKAKAYRHWGRFGDALTCSTVVYDFERKVSASTASYEPGFLEISVGTFSDDETSAHTLVYKGGVLFMTRDSKTKPINRTGTGPRDPDDEAHP